MTEIGKIEKSGLAQLDDGSAMKMDDEVFAQLIHDAGLEELEDGSFSGNYYGLFPSRAMVERVLSGACDELAYKEGPTRRITLCRNRTTGEFYEAYLAKSCGDPYYLPVDDVLSWLANVGDGEPAHIEFTDTDLIAFNLPDELRKRITAKANAEWLPLGEWVRRSLEECLSKPGSPASKELQDTALYQ